MSPSHPPSLAVAAAIADRLADPLAVRTAHGSRHQPPQSLAGGAAGVALLHVERARVGYGDWATAHAWLSAAARDDLTAGPNANLFLGAPALAFVTRAAADRPGKYERALADLDTSTAAVTRRRLDEAHARIDRGDCPALAEFDLIRGLTGLGAYHLQCDSHHDLTLAVLSYLVRLTEPLHHDGEGLPGWWTHLDPSGRMSPEYSGGHGNLGMTHGITGPLALLATAMKRGVTVHGHTEAIGRICAWVDTWRHDYGAGPWWPQWVTRDEQRASRSTQAGPLRPSWCYGTPGQARAQQLAGQATGDTERQHLAEEALLGCVTDERQLSYLTDASLCHGWAGLVHTVWRATADAYTGELSTHVPHLRDRLIHHCGEPGTKPGLLEGDAGPALALHTTAADAPPPPEWDACLLTNG